jgi:hypothetical protein
MNRVSGKEIIQAVIEDMHEGREELRYSVLPPGIYRIYLHETDYKRLSPVAKHIVDEASQALDEEVDQLNGQPGARSEGLFENLRGSFLSFKQKAESVVHGDSRRREWRKPGEGWQISINVDPNDELEPGDLCVNSELMLPSRVQLGAGNPTRNLTTIRRKGATLKSSRKYGNETSLTPTSEQPQVSDDDAYGLLRYQEEGKEKVFPITKNKILVGRAGPQSTADLPLAGDAKISREHFILRLDEPSGRFYITDRSKFGTIVNGIELKRERTTGDVDPGHHSSETELPRKATIELAGSLKMEFEALK